MKINGFKSRKELIENLYGASTLVDENARPYRDAEISIATVAIDELRPTQYYAIGENIERQRQLRDAILPYGEDTIRMQSGGVEIEQAEGECEIMIPPLVEEDAKEGLMLVDGTHRAMLAKTMGGESHECYTCAAC